MTKQRTPNRQTVNLRKSSKHCERLDISHLLSCGCFFRKESCARALPSQNAYWQDHPNLGETHHYCLCVVCGPRTTREPCPVIIILCLLSQAQQVRWVRIPPPALLDEPPKSLRALRGPRHLKWNPLCALSNLDTYETGRLPAGILLLHLDSRDKVYERQGEPVASVRIVGRSSERNSHGVLFELRQENRETYSIQRVRFLLRPMPRIIHDQPMRIARFDGIWI
jgi:hypothetical protein